MSNIKVVVQRSKWLRGEGTSASKLLRPSDGKMCCLGFACLALGATEAQIKGAASPADVVDVSENLLPIRHRVRENGRWHPEAISDAMVINDAQGITDAQREPELVALLARVGIDLEFVD